MLDECERLVDAAVAARDFAKARSFLEALVLDDTERADLHLKLAGMRRADGDVRGALAAIDTALALGPRDPTALLMRAATLDALGETEAAGEGFGRALAQLSQPISPALAGIAAHARARFAAWQQAGADRLRAQVAAVTPLTPALERLITNVLHITEPDQVGPTHYSYPGLSTSGWCDRVSFPWLAALEAATDTIAAEYANLVAGRTAARVPYVRYPAGVPLDQWAALNDSEDWSALHLFDRGRPVDANAAACPRTLELLAILPQPDVPSVGPNAMFSLLKPGAHIPPHTGVANTRLVCHLPLIVPEGCWFRVGDEKRAWQRGEAFVFDDTVEHEAMNPSDALRVVLIFDVWHPALDDAARAGVAAVMGRGGAIHRL